MSESAEQVAALLRVSGYDQVVAIGVAGYRRALDAAGHPVPPAVAELLDALSNRGDRRRQTVLAMSPTGDTQTVPLLASRADAATVLGVSLRTLDRRLRDGGLNHRRLGRRVLVDLGGSA